MKKVILLSLFGFATCVKVANAGVNINPTNFPDDNFFKYAFGYADINKDLFLSDSELANWKEINVDGWDIANLKGIEYFTALERLFCNDNQLATLDLSKNTKLKVLECNNNKLTSLNVTKNTALTTLKCSDNKLTSIDVTKNTALIFLNCSSNLLTKLDVTMNTKLRDLNCYGNQLTSLNVTKNTVLDGLACSVNKIKGSDMDALIAGLPNAGGSFCAIAPNFSTEQNVLTVTQVVAAKKKGWTPKYWTGSTWNSGKWDVYAGLPDGVAVNATNFPDANFLNVVKKFDKDESKYLTDAEIAAVKSMGVPENVSNLKGIEFFTALEDLHCGGAQLTSLDLSKNTALVNVYCMKNKLTSLNVTKNTKLKTLLCYENQLTSIDVTKNTALTDLECDKNKLTSLNVANNTKLQALRCDGNQLTNLNVTKNTALKELSCCNNKLTSLDVTKNTALEWLFCERNQLTKLDVSNNKSLWKLHCAGNKIKGSAMDALIAGLPRASGEFYAIAPNISTEQNVLTTTQVQAAKQQLWISYYWTGSTWDTGKWSIYAGSTSGIADIEDTTPTDNRYYTLDGKPLEAAPTQKGIYILNGRKVVVK